MSAASLDATVTRAEFDSAIKRLVERMTTLESTVSQASRPETRDSERTAEPSSEVVTQNEFRLFKWLGAFALAAVVGGFGFLHQQLDRGFEAVRVEMKGLHTQFGELRQEVGGLRQEMEAEFAIIRSEISRNREDIGKLREDVGDLRERVVRIETLLSGEGRVAPS